jgi:hypothetical protein
MASLSRFVDAVSPRTKTWQCGHCGFNNTTSARDLFRDQCHYCTEYNDIDWTTDDQPTLSELRDLADDAPDSG